MSSTGPLAELLRASSDDELVDALARRGVSGNGIRDFFDLAEELLSTNSLQQCLTRLDRRALNALMQLRADPSPTSAVPATAHTTGELDAAELQSLRRLLLVHDTPQGVSAWPAVGELLATWPALGLQDPLDDAPEPGNGAANPGTANDIALAAERASTATSAIAELLFELEREPLKLLATGTVGRPSARKLADLLRIDETDVATFIDIAHHAGLTSHVNGKLLPSDSHREWLGLGPAERWVSIADAWAHAHWPNIRARIGRRATLFRADVQGADVRAWLAWNYPGGRDWLPECMTKLLSEAEMLGVTANANISTPGAHVLIGELDEATALLTTALPTPVDHLYLQHDLTAVAPGPLRPELDTRLRTMAAVDGHAIASRYRFTSASIARAISGSETAASILEFLASITLSGIPQPLEYLITETAARHGLLRVGSLVAGDPHAFAYIRSDDAVLLRTVLIDRNLAALRLRPYGEERLASACDRDQLYSVLFHAKYPVAIEDSHGRIMQVRSGGGTRFTGNTPAVAPRPHPHLTLVEKLRIADAEAPEDSGEALLSRQLDAAIRSKSTVTVSVQMPNGKVVDYRLEPAAISRGRVRARDPLSEIERTLPLSSIVSVRQE